MILKRIRTEKSFKKNFFLACGLAIAGAVVAIAGPVFADTRADTLQALKEHYRKGPTMTGEFLQFGPQGDQSSGTQPRRGAGRWGRTMVQRDHQRRIDETRPR